MAIPALVALLPAQVAFGDSSTPSTGSIKLSSPTSVNKLTGALSSTVAGLGLSSYSSGSTLGTSALTSSPSSMGTDATCAGVCVDSKGLTVQGDATSGGLYVTLCDLALNDSQVVGETSVGLGTAPSSTGCGDSSTTAKGNLAGAVGRTHADALNNDIAAADICGIAAALSADPTSVFVKCGPDPATGSVAGSGNAVGLVGPSAGSIDSSGNFGVDICGVVAAGSLDSTKPAEGYVSCASATGVPAWAGTVPGLVVMTGDNFLSADVKKALVSADLSKGFVWVQTCGVDANVGGSGGLTANVPQTAVGLDSAGPHVITGLTLNGSPVIPKGTLIGSGSYPSNPSINCAGDANGSPVIATNPSTEPGVTAAVGNTGGQGTGNGSADAGSCGGGGNGSGGGPNSTEVFCGQNGQPFPSTGPCSPTAAPTQAEGCGNVVVVLGQTSGTGGPNPAGCTGSGCSSGGVTADTGCVGGAGTTGVGAVNCPESTNAAGAVLGVSTGPSPKKQPSGAPNAVQGSTLAETGLPILAGLAGLILIAVGSIDAYRRKRFEA